MAGIPDVVVDQHTGRLVEEGDRRGMAEAMALLADRPDLAAAWGLPVNVGSRHDSP